MVCIESELYVRFGSKADILRRNRHVRFGSKADMCGASTHVRFTPHSDRESGLPPKVMSALPPKADMCAALAHVRFGPEADILQVVVEALRTNAPWHTNAYRTGKRWWTIQLAC